MTTVTPLLFVDGHHLLYRSWWGFTDKRITSSDGSRDLTGVFGFLAILRKTHMETAADHEIVVVFDGENAAASRQTQHAEYKADRATADHTPIQSLRMVKDGLDAVGVDWIELDDVEGDDVLATLTSQAVRDSRDVTCYSGDRDLLQLVSDTTSILNPARRRITVTDVVDRYRVRPEQWPDFRALTGDPSDNIPGIRGIGPKIAAALLADGLHLDQLHDSPRLHRPRYRTLIDAWAQVLTWRDLIRLNHQVALSHNPCNGTPTPALPRAATVLHQLALW